MMIGYAPTYVADDITLKNYGHIYDGYSCACHVTLYTDFVCRYATFDTLPNYKLLVCGVIVCVCGLAQSYQVMWEGHHQRVLYSVSRAQHNVSRFRQNESPSTIDDMIKLIKVVPDLQGSHKFF